MVITIDCYYNIIQMKLQVVILKNDNLLQKFPKDPDYDVTIICNDTKFKLQIAFLYLESKYFDEIEQLKQKEVDLHHLDEEALQNVLMVLYGGEIIIKSFEVLGKIYSTINFLKIDSLKQMIIEQLRQQLTSVNSIQLLEFSYQHNVLKNEVSTLFFSNDLEVLRDPKYSMELNKLSQKILSVILLEYYQKAQNTNFPQIQIVRTYISGILSDYFHTNKRNPEEYFSKHNVEILKEIWYESHPGYYSQSMYASGDSPHEIKSKEIEQYKERIKNLEEFQQKQLEQIKVLKQEKERLKSKITERQQNRKILQQLSLEPAKTGFADVINKPPPLPPSIPNRRQFNAQDQEHQPNRKIYITQGIKTKQGINKIHTRNNSRGKI